MIHIRASPIVFQPPKPKSNAPPEARWVKLPLPTANPAATRATMSRIFSPVSDVLDPGPELEAARVEEGEEGDDQDGEGLLQDDGLGGRAEEPQMEEAREGPGQVFGEADGRGGDGRGEADEKGDPPGEEAQQRMEEPRQEGVFPSRVGHGRAELAVAQGAAQGDDRRRRPTGRA